MAQQPAPLHFGMKTTINKPLLIKTAAISTHAILLESRSCVKKQKNMQSEASFTPRYCTETKYRGTHIYYSICSKANGKDDREEAVPCDDEESVLPHHQDQTPYPVVFQDALPERGEMTQWRAGTL